MFLLVFQKSSSFRRDNEIFENKKQKMDKLLTYKKAKIGPVFYALGLQFGAFFVTEKDIGTNWGDSHTPATEFNISPAGIKNDSHRVNVTLGGLW